MLLGITDRSEMKDEKLFIYESVYIILSTKFGRIYETEKLYAMIDLVMKVDLLNQKFRNITKLAV
jgi:hypothetical protein